MEYLHDKEDHYFVGNSIAPAAVSLVKHKSLVVTPALPVVTSILYRRLLNCQHKQKTHTDQATRSPLMKCLP